MMYCMLVLFTNMKSYASFRLVTKSMTLNDLERRNDRYYALLHWMRYVSKLIL